MSRLSQIKLGVATIGIIVWAVGIRRDDPLLTWMGIAFLAASALLRFVGPRSSRHGRRDDVP
ncbi:MAG TPA: hypothetical protein VJU87_06190 [Gemmatimonadaceae bacterium]|nr:hypothetical protein [Gemmatimonadaceae bacterium]